MNIKRITTLLLFAIIPLLSMSQLTFDIRGVVTKKISSSLPGGSVINLRAIDYYTSGDFGTWKALVVFNGVEEEFDFKKLDNISFSLKPSNAKEFWQKQALNFGVYNNITKNGIQYGMRKELEQEALDYINYTENNNMIFRDSYLESYLYALSYKVYPIRLEDGRPGILNVKILKDIVPNAFIFSNGTMFLTTGLLSTINSEEELIGVMAHEISHFVLDHQIININKAEQRQKRAEFWAAVTTGVAIAADVYTSVNNEYYTPGTITMGTLLLAHSITSELNKRMGLEFSRDQETKADKCATELMSFIEIDPTALSSALRKIKKYSILSGNYLALSGEGM